MSDKEENNITKWSKTQKLSARYILKGLVSHFKQDGGFRFNCVVAIMYSITVAITYKIFCIVWSDQVTASNHPSFTKLSFFLGAIFTSFFIGFLELLLFAGLAELLGKFKMFLTKMNALGVSEEYHSVVKLGEEKKEEKDE